MSSSNNTGAARIARSFLFVPGDRPERFAKAAASGAHEVILDLEDAVAPEAKAHARTAVAAWLADGARALVRINAADTEWFEQDLAMARAAPSAGVMLPKADAASTARVAHALPGRSIVALVETVGGYMELRQLAAIPGLHRIAFGSVDFAGESGIADEGDAMTAIRTQIVLESRYAGLIAPIDGVSVEFGDEERMRSDALRSQAARFRRQALHPSPAGCAGERRLPSHARRAAMGATGARRVRGQPRSRDRGRRQDDRQAGCRAGAAYSSRREGGGRRLAA